MKPKMRMTGQRRLVIGGQKEGRERITVTVMLLPYVERRFIANTDPQIQSMRRFRLCTTVSCVAASSCIYRWVIRRGPYHTKSRSSHWVPVLPTTSTFTASKPDPVFSPNHNAPFPVSKLVVADLQAWVMKIRLVYLALYPDLTHPKQR